MIIRNASLGQFKKNPYVIGSTSANFYTPVYAIHPNKVMSYVINDVYTYNKPYNTAKNLGAELNTYSSLFESLREVIVPRTYVFGYKENDYILNCLKGYLSDSDDNILLLLCSNDYKSCFNDDNTIAKEKLTLFVSQELLNNEIYKNLLRKLNSEFIDPCHAMGIDVTYTNSERIENHVYKNEFKVEYSSLTDLHEHLNTQPAEIYNFQIADYQIIHEGETEQEIEPETPDDLPW